MEVIFNFLRGFISVEVTGFSISRFLNLCKNKGVYLWGIKYNGNKMICNTKIKNFYPMINIAKKTGCKIKIAEKVGIPFITFKHRRRKILIFGNLFFLFTIYILSTHIWYIDISGNSKINDYEILEVLHNNDVKVGVKKSDVNLEDIEKAIQKKYNNVVWVSAYKEGTTLVVRLSESVQNNVVFNDGQMSHIVAKKDGVVVYTKTSKGKQVVKIGDVVKKGEILVSGEIFLNEDENGKHYSYVNAVSEVRAETIYNFDFEIDKNLIIKTPSGKSKNNYKVNIFGKTYDLFKPKINFEDYDKNTYRTQLKLSEKYLLPIVIINEEYIENNIKIRRKTDEEIQAESEKIVNNIINTKLNINIDIIDKVISLKKTSQNIEVYSIIYVIENIGEVEVFTNNLIYEVEEPEDEGDSNNDT